MKRYTVELIFGQGNDEFWEDATKNGKTGCEDVLDMVRTGLEDMGFDFGEDNRYDNSIRIVRFTDE